MERFAEPCHACLPTLLLLHRTRVGLAMLILQGLGLLLFLITAAILVASFVRSDLVKRVLLGPRPADKFAAVITQVMAKVRVCCKCSASSALLPSWGLPVHCAASSMMALQCSYVLQQQVLAFKPAEQGLS